jgi:hypothetical protein
MHPHEPSCLRTYITFFLRSVPIFSRFFALIFTALALPRYKAFLASPILTLNTLARTILRTTLFASASIGTAWGSICLFQAILPRNFLPTSRWFWSGFLAGLPAFLERKRGRATFLYSTRASIDSLWKVGVKKGWWRSGRNGDVLVFVAALGLLNVVYEVNPRAVDSGVMRKGLGMLRGESWVNHVSSEKGTGEKE